MAARFNKCANPSCANNLTDWVGAGTRTRLTGLTGTPRTTGVSVPTTAASFTQSLGSPSGAAASGQVWTGVGWVRHSTARTVRVALVTRQNGTIVGTGTAGITDVALVANTWTQIRVTGTLGAGTFNQVNYHVDLPTAATAGTLSVSSVRIEQISDATLTYADGDSGSGWVWDTPASPGNSTSTLPDVGQVAGSASATFGFTATASGTGGAPGTTTRHNLCPNPAAANNVLGYFAPNTSQAQVTGQTGLPRTTGVTGDGGDWTAPRCNVVVGTTYRASGYLKMPGGTGGSGVVEIHWYNAAGWLAASTGAPWSAAAGAVVRVDTAAAAAPAEAVEGILFLSGLPTGAVLTAVLFEESATLGDYFDGTPPGTWDGTAGNSTSTLVTSGSEITGTADAELGGLTGVAQGTRTANGTGTAGLSGLSAALSGTRTTPGTGTALLGTLAATASGVRATAGWANAGLGELAATSDGARTVVGAVSASLGDLAAVASGTVTAQALAQAAIGDLTASATGAPSTEGSASAPLGGLAATATGVRDATGTGSSELGALTGSATGAVFQGAFATAWLGDLDAAASGTVQVVAVATATIGQLTATADGHRGSDGTAEAVLGAITALADGAIIPPVTGTAAAPLGALVAFANGDGVGIVTGTATAVLGRLSALVRGVVPSRPRAGMPRVLPAAAAGMPTEFAAAAAGAPTVA